MVVKTGGAGNNAPLCARSLLLKKHYSKQKNKPKIKSR